MSAQTYTHRLSCVTWVTSTLLAVLVSVLSACESPAAKRGEPAGESLDDDSPRTSLGDIVDLRVGAAGMCVLTSQRRLFCGLAFSSEVTLVSDQVERFDVGERAFCFQSDDSVVRCGVVESVDHTLTWRAIGHTQAIPSVRWLAFEGPSMKLCLGPVGQANDEIGCLDVDVRRARGERATLDLVRLDVGLTEVDEVWNDSQVTCAANRRGDVHCVEQTGRGVPPLSRHVTFESQPSSSARTLDFACRLRQGEVSCSYKDAGYDAFVLPRNFESEVLTSLIGDERTICVSTKANIHACLEPSVGFAYAPQYDGLEGLRFGVSGEYCGERSPGQARCRVESPRPQEYRCRPDEAQGLICTHAGWFGDCAPDVDSTPAVVCRAWPPVESSPGEAGNVSIVSHHACRLSDGRLSCVRWDPMQQGPARDVCQEVAGAPCDATPYSPPLPTGLSGAQLVELFDDDLNTLCVSADNRRHACVGFWAFAGSDDEALVHRTEREAWSPSFRHVPELDGYTRVRIADGGERWCGLLPDGTVECNGRPLTIESPRASE